jgi:tetratricopeptide (TPR) repeat protein
MPSRPVKLSRRDLSQPNEFLTLGDRALEFVKAYAKPLGLALGGVLVAIMIGVGIRQYQKHQDRLTAENFYEAFIALQKHQYELAENGFRRLAREHPRRRLGRLAKFYLAMCYMEQGQLVQARSALIEALTSLDDSLFKGMALMDLGSLYEQAGDLKSAQATYREANELRASADSQSAELALARVRAELGEKDAAIKDYRRFLEKHPYAQQRQDVLEALAALGASPTPDVPVATRKTSAAH